MLIVEGILDELSWLNALLRARIRTFRRQLTDPYRGLYISDADADADLSVVPLLDAPEDYVEVLEQVRRLSPDRVDTSAVDARPPLDDLTQAARLSEFERGVLLVCLAPEVDLRYQRLYAYLHDDVTKKAPTGDLVLNLLCATHDERVRSRGALAEAGALRVLGLMEVSAPDADVHAPFLAHSLRLHTRLTGPHFAGSSKPSDRWRRVISARRAATSAAARATGPAGARGTRSRRSRQAGPDTRPRRETGGPAPGGCRGSRGRSDTGTGSGRYG